MIYLTKIKIYQDNLLPTYKLSPLEKLDIKYNLKGKELIQNKARELVSFPFILSFSYIEFKGNILSSTNAIYYAISIKAVL